LNPLEKAYWIGKGVGWDNVPRRVYQSLAIRSGWLRSQLADNAYHADRCPLGKLAESERLQQWQQRRHRFFPLPTSQQLQELVDRATWKTHVESSAERALAGYYPMFSRWESPIGWPPNFNRDESNSIDWPVYTHWLDSARSGPPRNDLKLVWEPSRLTLAYHFARAYRYSNDEKWAEAFWTLLDAWGEQNPINQSVAWGCGQEIAFRLMAIFFGAMVTLDSPSATPERLARVDCLAWQSATRIKANINYAISQENNHALSEATVLFTVGLLYPELPNSNRWMQYGKDVLQNEIARQIGMGGSYVQHSMSYHRVMLDDLVWAIQLGNINGVHFDKQTLERVRNSVRWLAEFVDSKTGRVPNCGANDGANVLPLSCSDYLDYRPILDVSNRLLDAQVPSFGRGAWQEKSLWLGLSSKNDSNSNVLPARPRTTMWNDPTGGYHIMRGESSYLMIRAGNYKDRPGQCDMLHVDIWNDGENVVRDTGSFRYYHENKAIKNYFYSVAAHSTVQFLNQEQMVKGPNFLWFRWPKTDIRIESDVCIHCSSRFASQVPYVHERRISRENERYKVEDRVDGLIRAANRNEFVARWQLTPSYEWTITSANQIVGRSNGATKYSICLESEGGVDAKVVQGWESLYYGQRTTIPVLEVRVIGSQLVTILEPTNDAARRSAP
jgi:hypothetical protein